jgi:hypothetical protein
MRHRLTARFVVAASLSLVVAALVFAVLRS